MFFSPSREDSSWSWTQLIKTRNVKPGGLWEGDSGPPVCLQPWLPRGVKNPCSCLHAFSPQCVSSLYNLDPSCILWPRMSNGYFFFPLHNPKGRVVGGCQGVVGRGWNKTRGLLTLQRLFQFVQIVAHRPLSLYPCQQSVGLQPE